MDISSELEPFVRCFGHQLFFQRHPRSRQQRLVSVLVLILVDASEYYKASYFRDVQRVKESKVLIVFS